MWIFQLQRDLAFSSRRPVHLEPAIPRAQYRSADASRIAHQLRAPRACGRGPQAHELDAGEPERAWSAVAGSGRPVLQEIRTKKLIAEGLGIFAESGQ